MKTLLLANKNFSEYYIFCPFCKRMTWDGNIEIDDYVKSNCLFWCNNCDEIMICPTGLNDKNNELDNLHVGKPVHSCSKLLSLDETKAYMKEMSFVTNENLDEYYAYTIGILRFSCLSRKPFDGMVNSDDDDSNKSSDDDDSSIKTWDVDVMRFKDLPKDVDHSHDGVYLYYKANCSECGKYYESFIWGD